MQGYDTDRESFVGLYNELSEPQAVLNGKAADSLAHGWSPIASHYLEITQAAGESRDLIFILGYEENPQEEKFENGKGYGLQVNGSKEELITSLGEKDHHIINKSRAHEVIRRFATVEAVDAAFVELCALLDKLGAEFTTQEAYDAGDSLEMGKSTVMDHLTFCRQNKLIERFARGRYRKL